MRSTFSIRHYQQEIEFLKNKQRLPLHTQANACFVVDTTDDFVIRASHAPERFLDVNFFTATEMTPTEKESFLQMLENGTRFYFCHRNKPMLIFPDWLRDTGLLLLLSPNLNAIATETALGHFASRHFAFPKASKNQSIDLAAWQTSFDSLSEIFALLDFVLEESSAQSSYQVLAEVAALFGCLLEEDSAHASTFSNWEIS